MELSPKELENLNNYIKMLINYPINLTSYKDEKKAFENLILDSLIPVMKDERFLNSQNVVDVGTGGGIPGIVWAICFPNKKFYLVDSTRKKIQAVRLFIKKLNLKNVEVFDERVEVFAKKYKEFFDYATCKALSRSDIALEYLSPLVKIGGTIALFKGPSYFSEEIIYVERVEKILKVKKEYEIEYEVGNGEIKKRYLVIFKKVGKIPQKFPREIGFAKKYPLGESTND
ncbi:16S rRNA (guanine(527)-N(7))-methyltransferase RsmG [Petrotoga sp. 9PWA.NaAc.5.4]|jgi:16S rRNA (guanine527-N7)-methyltransferase|uniref:16S rRNA (guanine(527)-N(7))-methyltransferase RsmG n=1 Tax=Petrotoga sp. 9PWA.NaAc.5.4 TaxID=1434328 RepID=UPI000CA9C2F2|nr:16S rRNA (guanine(527)-N(7))-methyltransferase RsmG [Petrotoga sp. 9PWA.NaAc.5.4]PNR96785.1 16S rRNA methyltransferase [Petrotoga sp. 9PWA.NaAc.5.4]